MWTVPLLSPCFTLTFSKSCPKVILLMALPASEEWTRTEVCAGPGSGHLGMDFLCPRSGSGYWELDPEAGRRLQLGTSLYPMDLGGAWSQDSQSRCPIKKCFPHLNVYTHYLELVKMRFLGLLGDVDILVRYAIITSTQEMGCHRYACL